MKELIFAIRELEQLKTVERGLNVGNRKESSAEHSWSCMLIADILLDYVDEPLDRLKIFEYLLYHDVVEVYAGDAKFNNPEEMRLKHKKEEVAFKKISKLLPKPERYITICEEYESRKTREAEYAKAIDCLDSCFRNLNDDQKVNTDGFTEDLIRKKYLPHISKFSFLHKLFNELMSELSELKKI